MLCVFACLGKAWLWNVVLLHRTLSTVMAVACVCVCAWRCSCVQRVNMPLITHVQLTPTVCLLFSMRAVALAQ